MKKIVFLFILAVAACMNVSGQDKVDRILNSVNQTIYNIERTERAFKDLGRAVGIKSRRDKAYSEYDYKTNITTEYRSRVLSSVYCDNVWVEVYDDRVAVYLVQNRNWVLDQIIYRNAFGEYWVTNKAVCGNYRNVKVHIMVNRERTMIWFWHGSDVIKAFTVQTHFKSSWK